MDFQPGWADELRARIAKEGRLESSDAIDYFVFNRGVSLEMPAFAIGRPFWDNWFLFHMRKLGFPLIEATDAILAVHQNHDYRHVPEGKGPRWEGPEADRNFELAGGWQHLCTQEEATHRLTESGLKRRLDWLRLKRHIHTIPELHPRLFPLYWMANATARVLRGLHLR
jgi:hypothetical protein